MTSFLNFLFYDVLGDFVPGRLRHRYGIGTHANDLPVPGVVQGGQLGNLAAQAATWLFGTVIRRFCSEAERLVSREEGRPRGASDTAASQRPGRQQLIGVASLRLRATSPGIDGRGLGWRVLFSKLREVPSRLVPRHVHQDVGCPRNLKKTPSVHVDCARGHCHFQQHSGVPQV